MENPVAFEVHYREYQRQAAWINHEDWKIERKAKRYQVRVVVAKRLIALAARIAPAITQPNTSTPARAQ